MRKTYSIYCSDDEYRRIKIALRLMRIFDTLSLNDLSSEQCSKYFLKIMEGDDEK